MTTGQLAVGPRTAEIVSGEVSGGPNTSHTIVVSSLAALLDAVPMGASRVEYEKAALVDNVLGKQTEGARRRTFRYLKELYLLRPDSLLFRALRDLWGDDPRPSRCWRGFVRSHAMWSFAQAAGDLQSSPGEILRSRQLAEAVGERFPVSYRESTLAKIGRNVFSSWEQTGHLAKGRARDEGANPGEVPSGKCCLRVAARPSGGGSRTGPFRDAVGEGARSAHVAPARPRGSLPRSTGCSSSATPAV